MAFYKAAASGNVQGVISFVESKKKKVNKTNKQGQTALHLAALNGHRQILLILLKNGADAEILNKELESALHMSARGGHVSCMNLLQSHGLTIHDRNKIGRTALHLASEFGHEKLAIELVKLGADIEEKDKYGLTPLDIAISEDFSINLRVELSKLAEEKEEEKKNEIRGKEQLYELYNPQLLPHIDSVLVYLKRTTQVLERTSNMSEISLITKFCNYVQAIVCEPVNEVDLSVVSDLCLKNAAPPGKVPSEVVMQSVKDAVYSVLVPCLQSLESMRLKKLDTAEEYKAIFDRVYAVHLAQSFFFSDPEPQKVWRDSASQEVEEDVAELENLVGELVDVLSGLVIDIKGVNESSFSLEVLETVHKSLMIPQHDTFYFQSQLREDIDQKFEENNLMEETNVIQCQSKLSAIVQLLSDMVTKSKYDSEALKENTERLSLIISKLETSLDSKFIWEGVVGVGPELLEDLTGNIDDPVDLPDLAASGEDSGTEDVALGELSFNSELGFLSGKKKLEMELGTLPMPDVDSKVETTRESRSASDSANDPEPLSEVESVGEPEVVKDASESDAKSSDVEALPVSESDSEVLSGAESEGDKKPLPQSDSKPDALDELISSIGRSGEMEVDSGSEGERKPLPQSDSNPDALDEIISSIGRSGEMETDSESAVESPVESPVESDKESEAHSEQISVADSESDVENIRKSSSKSESLNDLISSLVDGEKSESGTESDVASPEEEEALSEAESEKDETDLKSESKSESLEDLVSSSSGEQPAEYGDVVTSVVTSEPKPDNRPETKQEVTKVQDSNVETELKPEIEPEVLSTDSIVEVEALEDSEVESVEEEELVQQMEGVTEFIDVVVVEEARGIEKEEKKPGEGVEEEEAPSQEEMQGPKLYALAKKVEEQVDELRGGIVEVETLTQETESLDICFSVTSMLENVRTALMASNPRTLNVVSLYVRKPPETHTRFGLMKKVENTKKMIGGIVEKLFRSCDELKAECSTSMSEDSLNDMLAKAFIASRVVKVFLSESPSDFVKKKLESRTKSLEEKTALKVEVVRSNLKALAGYLGKANDLKLSISMGRIMKNIMTVVDAEPGMLPEQKELFVFKPRISGEKPDEDARVKMQQLLQASLTVYETILNRIGEKQVSLVSSRNDSELLFFDKQMNFVVAILNNFMQARQDDPSANEENTKGVKKIILRALDHLDMRIDFFRHELENVHTKEQLLLIVKMILLLCEHVASPKGIIDVSSLVVKPYFRSEEVDVIEERYLQMMKVARTKLDDIASTHRAFRESVPDLSHDDAVALGAKLHTMAIVLSKFFSGFTS